MPLFFTVWTLARCCSQRGLLGYAIEMTQRR